MTSITPIDASEIKYTDLQKRMIITAHIATAIMVNAIFISVISSVCTPEERAITGVCKIEAFPGQCNLHKLTMLVPCFLQDYKNLMGGSLPASFGLVVLYKITDKIYDRLKNNGILR